MGCTIGDGIAVGSLAAVFLAFLYFRHTERQRRLDIVHEERMAAMDRRVPVEDLRLDQASAPAPGHSKVILLHGIVWTMLSGGAMLIVAMMGPRPDFAVVLPAAAAVLSALGSLAYEAATLSRSVALHPARQVR